MLDPFFAKILRTPLEAGAAALHERRIEADTLTWAGFVSGLLAAVLLGVGWTAIAFVVLVLSRILSGLGATLARTTRTTEFGAYLDIVLELIVLGAVAAGFTLAAPANR